MDNDRKLLCAQCFNIHSDHPGSCKRYCTRCHRYTITDFKKTCVECRKKSLTGIRPDLSDETLKHIAFKIATDPEFKLKLAQYVAVYTPLDAVMFQEDVLRPPRFIAQPVKDML
jgi:hypothetical protein